MAKRKISKAIPDGFQVVKLTKSTSHDFSEYPVLTGKVLRVNSVTQDSDYGPRVARVATVHRGDKPVALWESSDLRGFFDAVSPGDDIYVRYDGLMQVKGMANPKKKFTVAIRPRGGLSHGKARRKPKAKPQSDQ